MERKIVLVLLLLLYSLHSTCTYVPAFEIKDDSVTTLYPNTGDNITLIFTIASREVYTGDLEVYLERNGITYPLKKERVYITRGDNEFKYTLQLPTTVPDGLYFMHISADGFDYTIPLIMGNGVNFTQVVEEDFVNKMINITWGINESVEVQYYARFYNGKTENKQYRLEPVDGNVKISERMCENCKMILLLGYNGTVARVERVYDIYSEPYLRIVEFDRNHLVLESCAPGSYETYVDGVPVGNNTGVGRIDKALNSGYESVEVRLARDTTLLEKNINLGLFKPLNVTLNLFIAKKSPFEIHITAKDEFGRDAKSEGYLIIEDMEGRPYVEFVSFVGEYVMRINLADGNYKVYYNGQSVEGSAVAQPHEIAEHKVEDKTLIPKDIVPLLVIVLIFALLVAVLIWLKKLRKI